MKTKIIDESNKKFIKTITYMKPMNPTRLDKSPPGGSKASKMAAAEGKKFPALGKLTIFPY